MDRCGGQGCRGCVQRHRKLEEIPRAAGVMLCVFPGMLDDDTQVRDLVTHFDIEWDDWVFSANRFMWVIWRCDAIRAFGEFDAVEYHWHIPLIQPRCVRR
jgi:hypothetical protein